MCSSLFTRGLFRSNNSVIPRDISSISQCCKKKKRNERVHTCKNEARVVKWRVKSSPTIPFPGAINQTIAGERCRAINRYECTFRHVPHDIRNPMECPIVLRIAGWTIDAFCAYMRTRRTTLFFSIYRDNYNLITLSSYISGTRSFFT